MRKVIISAILAVAATLSLSAQTPDWVKEHPVSKTEYIGIGMAQMSENDYARIATQAALSDMASQISMLLESASFLHQVDVDGQAREMFEDKISGSITAWLEGYELKDSYSANGVYYVCYSLNKKKYAEKAEARRQRAISEGLDCYLKGQAAEAAMELSKAVALYGKGLEAVEPWLFMDLVTVSAGKTVNVPVELYNAFISVFSGMAITANTLQVKGETFKAIPDPIAGCLSKNGTVVPNVKLKAWFATGEGEVTLAVETDYSGTAEFYVTNVISKEDVQEIRISIDDSVWASVPDAYVNLLKTNALPTAKITLVLESGPVTAYLHVGNNDLEGCEKHISALLANQYFTLTEDPDAAVCFIDLSSSLDMGTTVTGGTYDLNSCLCSLRLKIYDNHTGEMLMDYSVDGLRVLSPVHKSVEATMSTCVREVMKRVNRELPAKLAKVKVKQ